MLYDPVCIDMKGFSVKIENFVNDSLFYALVVEKTLNFFMVFSRCCMAKKFTKMIAARDFFFLFSINHSLFCGVVIAHQQERC